MYLNGGDNLDELAYHPVGRGAGVELLLADIMLHKPG